MSTLARRLSDKRVVICAGAGGVGKTTVSAAVALGLAMSGLRVAVVTIDPARRLAEALGLDELGNEPQPVDPERFAGSGVHLRGALSAMMLDPKRTFDDLIGRLAPSPRTRDQILANPVYANLSTAVAGSQEYTAIAKLFELAGERDYEAIVLDTPPSRSAIDFLNSPDRLISFLEGRAMGTLARPTRRLASAAGPVFAALRRITGVGLLDELNTFFTLVGGLLEGFRTRAADVRQLLSDQATGFLVVTSPQRAAVEEAIFFAEELDRAGMHRSALIINRIHPFDPYERDTAATTARLQGALGARLARLVARTHADLQLLARDDQAALQRLRLMLREPGPICLADRESDVHDVGALVDLQRELFRAT